MYSSTTEHYQLPQYSGSDVPSILDDLNEAYEKLDNVLWEHGEGIASVMADNVKIHNELTEIRTENNVIQQEILTIGAKNREQDDRLSGLDKVVEALTNTSDPSGEIPSWRDPTSSDFDSERYKLYISNLTKQTSVETIYPIGIVLAFNNTTDPNNVFKSTSADVDFDTTWVALDDGVVLMQGTASNVGQNNGVTSNTKTVSADLGSVTLSGTTGSHAITVAEMPSHNHTNGTPLVASLVADGNAKNVILYGSTDNYADYTNYFRRTGRIYEGSPSSTAGITVESASPQIRPVASQYGTYCNTIQAVMQAGISYQVTPIAQGSSAGHTHSFSSSASIGTKTFDVDVTPKAHYVRYWTRTA